MAKAQETATVKRVFKEVALDQGTFWPGEETRPGELITGTYVTTREITSEKDGKAYPAHEIRGEDDGRLYIVTGAVLTRAFEALSEGAMVRLTYRGTKRLSRGRTLKEYFLEVAE